MKILWLCNIILPEIAEELHLSSPIRGGWLIQTAQELISKDDIEFAVCSPASKKIGNITGKAKDIDFLLFDRTDKNITSYFTDFLKKIQPDIIHIFGTEYFHSLAMVRAAQELNMLDKAVINIQGLCSAITKHYCLGLDNKVIHSYTIKDFMRHNNIYNQMLNFKKRGEYEIEAIKLVKNVIGRTDFDKAVTRKINPDINYHFCNETLRGSFYENQWDLDKCEKHSIFVTQSGYPLKGFHIMLEAMADIVKRYPDAKLYTTGKNPLTLSFKQKLRRDYYNKYIGKLIKKYKLENNIEFVGFLDEEKMCER